MKDKFRGYDPTIPQRCDHLHKNVIGSSYQRTSILIYSIMFVIFNLMYLFLNNWTIPQEHIDFDQPKFIAQVFVILYNLVILFYIIRSLIFYKKAKEEERKKSLPDYFNNTKYFNEILAAVDCRNCNQNKEKLSIGFRKNGDLEVFCDTCKSVIFEMTTSDQHYK
ncbi:hypothetical protein NZD88_20965 [Chryseobacterium antibioticum]|uniref:Uncharacterized protein n=1 Tax=Chryseobacterium pyrolae TaxID=2987481 RepID=A0ABT2IMZ2_9FLAO|nr:hypothetical protein [Chryseobacterium pyrolae]MCT2410035.1 hypothetical protein [Chryseobacterium pyrolae]